MNDKIKLDKYVENKIYRLNFVAKNFTKEDMDCVDSFCKARYDNNRKLMILDLIRYKEENIPLTILNDKLNLMYSELSSLIKISEPEVKEEVKKKSVWGGLKHD